jgi:hypothetical protein
MVRSWFVPFKDIISEPNFWKRTIEISQDITPPIGMVKEEEVERVVKLQFYSRFIFLNIDNG